MTHYKLIQENCPGGCPCDAYECEDITPTVTTTSVATTTVEPISKDAVLLLSTFFQSNVPMVIGYNGKLHPNMNLSLFLSQMTTTIFQVKWTMISTSHLKTTLKSITLVRRR